MIVTPGSRGDFFVAKIVLKIQFAQYFWEVLQNKKLFFVHVKTVIMKTVLMNE